VSEDLVIGVEDISKAYNLYARPADMLKELVLGGTHHDVFWALRNVSFQVAHGDRIGIVGPNGAGKSTLLQIIAGNLRPTSGRLQVNGSISALLSLVPAWNVNHTGLENVRFNLLLRGCTSRRIPLLTEEIVDFAELGSFINQPVKTYSAGMSARLSFAIATAISPEILIVDEVLGAGDGYFAGKAARRMTEMCDRGKALLFVSHSTGAVQQMCSRVIWLQNGVIRMDGEAQYVLRQYELDYRRAEDETTRTGHRQRAEMVPSTATSDEWLDDRRVRFRIVRGDRRRFAATHYVQEIRVRTGGGVERCVPLDDHARDHAASPALDLDSSEWGRLHERDGHLARTLTRAHGRRPGGHFSIALDESADSVPFEVQLSATTDGAEETLALDVLNPETATWDAAECVQSIDHDGITFTRFTGWIRFPSGEHADVVRTRIEEQTQSPVTIAEVAVLAHGHEVSSVLEHETFEVAVRVQFHRLVPIADVGLKITRSDGVYVFWQSSGLVGSNLEAATGVRTFRFQFASHVFGAGRYSASVIVANGWNHPDNYPYSQVYARALDVAHFEVVPEVHGLDFGVVNVRVPVVID